MKLVLEQNDVNLEIIFKPKLIEYEGDITQIR